MGKEEIFNYVMETPENTNPNVLRSLLDNNSGSDLPPVTPSDVNFIDYGGTIVAAYTAADFAQLTKMPENPFHKGLTAQGWNWFIEDAKTYVSTYGKLWIGQMYVTTSGDTEIDIELHAPRLTPYLGFAVNGTVEIDWGDGTAKDTVIGLNLTMQIRTPHTYSTEEQYTIKIHKVSGSYSLYGDSTYSILSRDSSNVDENKIYSNAVKNVRIGSDISSIGDYAFANCQSLTAVTIPSSVTSIGNNVFRNCQSLTAVTIPSNVTSIEYNTFYGCSSLHYVAIPRGVTSIEGAAFYNCQSFSGVAIPSHVTFIEDIFQSCNSLSSIIIPNDVMTIENWAFSGCYSLSSVIIPSYVTRIESYTFHDCVGLGSITFSSETPPTALNSTWYSSLPTDCIIYIPADNDIIIDSYLYATNYPSFNTYQYIGYATFGSGASLPGSSATGLLRWYATKEEAIANSGIQIFQGTGNEIYCYIEF